THGKEHQLGADRRGPGLRRAIHFYAIGSVAAHGQTGSAASQSAAREWYLGPRKCCSWPEVRMGQTNRFTIGIGHVPEALPQIGRVCPLYRDNQVAEQAPLYCLVA